MHKWLKWLINKLIINISMINNIVVWRLSVDIELADGTEGFPEEPVVDAFGVELVEARQDLYGLVFREGLNANRALVHLLCCLRHFVLLRLPRTYLALVLIRWQRRYVELCGFSGEWIERIEWGQHFIVILIEVSPHRGQLQHLQIPQQQGSV